jgi:hypothetical protein
MTRTQKTSGDLALRGAATGPKQKDRGDREAMSPSMRQLILSFADDGSDRVWDPDVYGRRPSNAAPSAA